MNPTLIVFPPKWKSFRHSGLQQEGCDVYAAHGGASHSAQNRSVKVVIVFENSAHRSFKVMLIKDQGKFMEI